MIKLAVLGFGTVGTGVVEVLCRNAKMINAHTAEEIELKYILDIIDFPDSPWADKIVHDFNVIENDPEIRIVVETIGGLRVAYDYTKRALMAGKSVVTSNKELVAQYGAELIKTARENNVNYLFEASVGGGIPILRPLTQCLSANNIHEITGVLNGTTNYILTRMKGGGADLHTALAEAKQLGYAEADPTADIEGHDACRKICILADLAYGHHISPSLVTTEGITGIESADMDFAERNGYTIKLLGRVLYREDGRVNILVAPHFIPSDKPLAGVNGVFNGIVVIGDAIDEVMFYGRGAGKYPTASAVVADIIDAAKHLNARRFIEWRDDNPDFVADTNEMEYRHYVRFSGPFAHEAAGTLGGDITREKKAVHVITPRIPTARVYSTINEFKKKNTTVHSVIRILE